MRGYRWFPTVVAAALLGRRRRRKCGPPATGRRSLAECPAGCSGIIEEVCGETPLTFRLREMGVVPGSCIRVLKSGNPILFQIAEGRYCIRRRDARCLVLSLP